MFEIIINFFSKYKLNYKKKLGSLYDNSAPLMLSKSSGFTKEGNSRYCHHSLLSLSACLDIKSLPIDLKRIIMTAITEHILKNRLGYYLEVNSLLPNNLYGFLEDLGTIYFHGFH